MWSARMSRHENALHMRQDATKTDGTTRTESRVRNDLKTAWIYPERFLEKTRKENQKEQLENKEKKETKQAKKIMKKISKNE